MNTIFLWVQQFELTFFMIQIVDLERYSYESITSEKIKSFDIFIFRVTERILEIYRIFSRLKNYEINCVYSVLLQIIQMNFLLPLVIEYFSFLLNNLNSQNTTSPYRFAAFHFNLLFFSWDNQISRFIFFFPKKFEWVQ